MSAVTPEQIPRYLSLTPTDRYRLRDIADAAYALGVTVGSNDDDYETADLMHYAAGVEDVLRFIVGDAAPTAELADVLRGVV